MSTAVAKTLPIGAVIAYWNGVRLGSPMSQATIRHNKETVQAPLEEAGLNVISHKTLETVEVDVVIADLKPSQLRYVYDKATGFASADTIDPNVYKASTSTVMRFKEVIVLDGVNSSTVERVGFSTVEVWKSDWSSLLVSGTDYTSDGSAGTLARIGGGDIGDGDSVNVLYQQSATVEKIYAGGGMEDFEAVLQLEHELKTGKFLQFYFHRAKKIGASDIAIQMAAEFGGVPMTFHCLADLAQAEGKQLFHISVEA